MSDTPRRPTTLLVAALGGEGGGVLVDWITRAAIAEGLHVTRTAIPGVAQRTGSTTYHVEVMPREAGDPPPVLGLNAAPGRVDVLVATELLEAVRRAEAGYVTPDRTLAIVARRRAYTVAEKAEGGDGRLAEAPLEQALRAASREARIADYAALAPGAPLNAVLLGALAASGALPIPPARFRAAIEEGGKATAANLRGFEAGLGAAPGAPPAPAMPPEAVALIEVGVARLTDYQDAALAERYLARLRSFAGAERRLLVALARHLALRMSPEDVIRVAQLKLRDARRARLAAEARARPGDIVHVVEFLKPGPAEILSLLPPALGTRLLAWVERRGWGGKAIALNVSPTRPLGFLRLRLLAGLRGWRPRTLRWHEQEEWVERWLDLVRRAAAVDPDLAVEVAETARLVKGYGAIEARGRANWTRIVEALVEPALAGDLPEAAEAVLQARLAALKDPEGDALDRTLAAIAARRERIPA